MKKLNLKRMIPKKLPFRRLKDDTSKLNEAIQNIPRITNETVAEHREKVLSSARKYIYPLKHSAHRIVFISTSIVIAAIVLFFAYCMLALYKFNSTSGFIYGVTQVIPFPIARAGSSFVDYENYLFELRHYIHYYETQQKVDFKSDAGKQQLASFKKRALQTVVDEAYIKQLASKYHVAVSNQDVNNEIAVMRSQNRLGSSDQVLSDVLKQFWGWSVDDFKRELKQQLLAQKVVSAADTATHRRAENALARLNAGADFGSVAKQVSDDLATKDNGGNYGGVIDRASTALPPQVMDELFRLQPGQTSGIINTGSTLEIVKVLDRTGDSLHAEHISFTFQDISVYINPLKQKEKQTTFIHP
jgi:parvulin-like peptidyl-prolyl isomerase